MTRGTVDLFINPTAGRGRAGKRLDRIAAVFAAEGLEVDVHASRGVGDMEQQVLEFATQGGQRLVVAGGDGSVHEAVNGIMRSGASTALGVIPTGTGNDFAKACDTPLDWSLATSMLAERLRDNVLPRQIDVAIMNDRYFANGAGIGLDARVTRIARSYRWPIGNLVYLLAILAAMRDGIATPEFTISSDEFKRRSPVTLASVANGAWIGGMFHIAPPADNADGRLNLVVADPVSRRRVLTLLPQVMKGEHFAEPEVGHVTVTSVRIESREPVPCHLDGEMQPEQTVFDFRVLPGALSVL